MSDILGSLFEAIDFDQKTLFSKSSAAKTLACDQVLIFQQVSAAAIAFNPTFWK